MFKWWFTLRHISQMASRQGSLVRYWNYIFPVTKFTPWNCSVCGFYPGMRPFLRSEPGDNIDLMMEWTTIWTVTICLWWDHACMVLKTVPLSPTLIHLTCTSDIDMHTFDWAAPQHWLGRKTEAMPPLKKLYSPSSHWLLLNRRRVKNWLRLPITNSNIWICAWGHSYMNRVVCRWMSFETTDSHNHFITGSNDRSTGGKNRHCTETTTTKIARYLWLKHCSTTKPHAKLKGERS